MLKAEVLLTCGEREHIIYVNGWGGMLTFSGVFWRFWRLGVWRYPDNKMALFWGVGSMAVDVSVCKPLAK